jgi:hypothetical protein
MTTLHFDIGRQTNSRKIGVLLSNLGTCAYRKSHPAKLGLLAEARGMRPAFAKRLRIQSVFAFISFKLRRTRFVLALSAWLRHA